MPPLATVPTELTTAGTDLLLALVAVGLCLWLRPLRRHDRFYLGLWQGVFALLALAALLGALTHGLQLPPWLYLLLWQPLYLAMGVVVALLLLAATAAARRARLPLLLLPAVFYLITLLFNGAFLPFVIYEGLALLFVLAVYLRLAFRRHPGAGLLCAGVLVTLLAAGLQASPVGFTLLWPFDHNGVFHLVQLPGLLLFAFGARRNILARASETGPPSKPSNS